MRINFLFVKTIVVLLLIINSISGFSQNKIQLTASEKEGVLLMREEEKLAHDVYSFFAEKYSIPVFRNIMQSEVRHQDAMIWLMEKYGIEDPSKTEEGKFYNKDLQKLYDKLTTEGNTVADALKIGAYIEDLDIFDLKKLISETENEDIIRIYSNLLRASENHFRAFTRNLSNRDVTYVPKHLTQTEMDEILSQNNNRGNRNGNGNGNRGRRGNGCRR